MKRVFYRDGQLSKFGKSRLNVLQLSRKTAEELLRRNSDFEPQFLVFGSFSPERYTGECNTAAKIAESLGLHSVFAIRTETASSSGASALQIGAGLIRSGNFQRGIVIATEVMSRLPREENNLLLGSVLGDNHRDLSMSMAQGGALLTQRYLHEYGYSREDLFFLSKKLHDNGLRNPKAHIQKEITYESYFSAPMFCDPLGLFDISPLSDGSAAILLDNSGPIEFRGFGYGTAPFQNLDGIPTFPASIQAFRRAYLEAEMGPQDIKVAELHDAFTTFELIGAEDAGLFQRGSALRKVREGETHPDGSLPINVSGGLKSRGHPVGASGLAQVVEIANYMRQNSDKSVGLVHSIGGLATNNFATILRIS